jgi:hypothetical protein
MLVFLGADVDQQLRKLPDGAIPDKGKGTMQAVLFTHSEVNATRKLEP